MTKKSKRVSHPSNKGKTEASPMTVIRATENQRTELRLLIREQERIVKTINEPLINLIMGLINYVFLQYVWEELELSFSSDDNTWFEDLLKNVSNENKDYAQLFIWMWSGALITVSGYYFLRKIFFQSCEQSLLRIFPNGFLLPRLKENYDMGLIENIFTSHDKITNLINHLKIHNRRLQEVALEVSTSQLVGTIGLFSFRLWLQSYDILHEFIEICSTAFAPVLLNNFYQQTMEFIYLNKEERKFDPFYQQIAFLSHHNLDLNEIKWEVRDKEQLFLTRFELTFPQKYKIQILNEEIPHEKTSINSQTYLKQLYLVMNKAGWEVASIHYYSLIIKLSTPISAKKLIDIQQEFRARLEHCVVVSNNKRKKLIQINQLLLAIGINANLYLIARSTQDGLPTFDVLLPISSRLFVIIDPFIKKCLELFNQAINADDKYITFVDYHLANQEALELVAHDLKSISPVQNSSGILVDENEMNNKMRGAANFEDDLLTDCNNENKKVKTKKNTSTIQPTMTYTDNPTPVKESTSTYKIVRRLLNMKKDQIFPMRMSWSIDTHFSMIDPRLKEHFPQSTDFDRVHSLVQQGNVVANNKKSKASSACIVPSAEDYKDVSGKTHQADYKVKTTNNIRVFGKRKQVTLPEGKIVNLVTFNGIKLKAH